MHFTLVQHLLLILFITMHGDIQLYAVCRVGWVLSIISHSLMITHDGLGFTLLKLKVKYNSFFFSKFLAICAKPIQQVYKNSLV